MVNRYDVNPAEEFLLSRGNSKIASLDELQDGMYVGACRHLGDSNCQSLNVFRIFNLEIVPAKLHVSNIDEAVFDNDYRMMSFVKRNGSGFKFSRPSFWANFDFESEGYKAHIKGQDVSYGWNELMSIGQNPDSRKIIPYIQDGYFTIDDELANYVESVTSQLKPGFDILSYLSKGYISRRPKKYPKNIDFKGLDKLVIKT